MSPAYSQGHMQPLFMQGPSTNLRLLFFALISLALMVVDHRADHFQALRSGLATALYPVQYLVNLPSALSSSIGESLATRQTLVTENAFLKNQNLLLKAQLQKFAALESENNRLRELLHSSKKLGTRLLIGELLAVDMDPFRHKLTINKGTQDGVVEGQPLLDSEGIMGQIVHVSRFTSTALLITDPSHALPVQINRNGVRAVAIGTGSFNRLDIPYLSKNSDVRVGDLLITSGLGGRFPPDYPVAKIVSVERDPSQPFAKVSAIPSARLERSREVLLVWPQAARTVAEINQRRAAAGGEANGTAASAATGISFIPLGPVTPSDLDGEEE